MDLKLATIKQITDSINGLLSGYSTEIEESAEVDGVAKISIPVKIEEDGHDVKVKIGMSFVKTKIADEVNFVVSDQKELFDTDE